jgi:competence protein ComEC
MKYWNKFPLLRLILPFIFGIILAVFIDSDVHIPISAFVICLIISVLFVFYYKTFVSYKYRWLPGIFIFIFLFLFGFELTVLNTDKFKPLYFGNYLSNEEQLSITEVSEPIVEKENSYKAIIKVKKIKRNNKWIKVKGKTIVYFEKDSFASNIKYGDYLLLNVHFQEVSPPQNPHEFNYKKYLSYKGIYEQAYLKSGSWQVLNHNNGNKIVSYALSLKDKLLKIFEKNNIKGDEFAVASAIILGKKDNLDPELLKKYSGSGAMHILCVSGLHVGIIYLVLNYFLFFLDKIRYGIIIKMILLILLIWFYALLTGLSPSVMRASTMFSFIIIGKSLNRNANIYNTLAVSAFLLLLINPFIITELGFQMSYLAVIGIVTLQQKIYNLWLTDNWLLDNVWAITTVSFTAQLFIFPLILLYFHQFPNYFFITNLIVIPVTSFVIYSGLLVLFTSPIAWLSAAISKIFVLLIKFLNLSVQIIENLPYSTTSGISINTTEMFLIYAVIISFIILFLNKNKQFFKYALLFSVFLCASVALKNYKQINQKKIIVYNISRTSAYDFVYEKQNLLLSDSLLLNDKKKQGFHLLNNWCKSGMNKTTIFDLSSIKNKEIKTNIFYKKNNFIQFYDKKIAVINNKNKDLASSHTINVDFLIIADNIRTKISDLLNQYNAKQIIIDSSNSLWNTNRLIKECKEKDIKCYSVLKSGAFVINV